MRREDLIFNLGRLGYALVRPETRKVKDYEVLELLDELAESEDPRLVEGFPVVLANCAQKDLKLDFRTLLSRHKFRQPQTTSSGKATVVELDFARSTGFGQTQKSREPIKIFEGKVW